MVGNDMTQARTYWTLVRALLVCVSALSVSACDFFATPQARVERAKSQIAARDYRRASIELRNALQDEPGNGDARRLLAEVSLQLGDASSAQAEVRRALDAGVPSVAVAEVSAKIQLAQGRFEDLLIAIESGESALPEPLTTLYRGQALQGLQRYMEAKEQFAAVLRQDETSPIALIGAAQADAGLGQLELALQRLDSLTQRNDQLAEAWLVKGTLLASRGQFDKALVALNTAQKVDGGQLTVQQQAVLLGTLIEVRLSQGDIPGAEAAYSALHRAFPAAPLTGLLGARIALIRQDYAGAATELQRLVTASPSFVGARFLLGSVSLAQGRLEQADLHLSQVVQSAPDNLEARKLLSQVRMRLDRPAEAVQVLVPALESGEFDARASALLGAAQLEAGQGGQELQILEAAAARNPDSTPLLLNLAAAYLRNGDFSKVLKVLNSPAGARGGVTRDALVIAAKSAGEGRASADAELNRILAQKPDDTATLNLAAGLYAQRGEFDRGRSVLVRALSREPDSTTTLLAMARLEAEAANLDVARGYLEKILTLDSASSVARLGLADIALRQGNVGSAIKLMEDWRAKEPWAAEPPYRLGRLYLINKQPELAQRVLTEAVSSAPDPARANGMVGALYLEMGRYEQAVASFRKAVEGDAGVPAYWLSLAQAQLALDQRPAARESIGRVLALRPGWVPAVGMAALLDLRDGKAQDAIDRVSALRQERPSDAAVRVLGGDVEFASKRYSDAAASFDAAFALKPEASSAVKSYQARTQGKLGNVTEPLTRWLAESPGDIGVRMLLAEAYQLSDQTGRAIQEYELVLKGGARSAMALNNLAWLYLLNKDPRAVDTSRAAFQLAPAVPEIADTYGWSLVENNRAGEGVPILEKAAKARPEAAGVQYHYAAALARTGRRDEAKRVLSALLDGEAAFAERPDAIRLQRDL